MILILSILIKAVHKNACHVLVIVCAENIFYAIYIYYIHYRKGEKIFNVNVRININVLCYCML